MSLPTVGPRHGTAQPVMTALRVHKPARVAATASVVVQVAGTAVLGEVIDFGLKALGESRSSLFGFGVEGLSREPLDLVLEPGTYTVYAFRD